MEADEQWKRTVDNRLDHLLEQQGAFDTRLDRIEANLAHMREGVADVQANMVIRHQFSELTRSMTHYAMHVEEMLNALSFEDRFKTLERV